MKTIKTIVVLLVMCGLLLPAVHAQYAMPDYMKGYESQWTASGPKKAAQEWFKDAQFGMFVHFTPASTLPDGDSDYAKLDPVHQIHPKAHTLDNYAFKDYLLNGRFGDDLDPGVESLLTSFKPENFSADSIADLAVKAGMKYITFISQHICGRLFMFNTAASKWNSKRTIDRDFVQEMAEACHKRGLGLFLYVTPPNNLLKSDLKLILKELLTNYGAIAGIWFDGIGECYNRPNDFLETGELYAYINELQPQCLISFKTGFTGDEDFLAPEWRQIQYADDGSVVLNLKSQNKDQIRPVVRVTANGLVRTYQSIEGTWLSELRYKPVELCSTMLKHDKWFDVENGIHKSLEDIKAEYNYVRKHKANYLLNVAPRKDGSIHPEDKAVLTQFGRLQKPLMSAK